MILEKDGPFDLLTRLTGAKGIVYIGQDSRLIQQLQSCFGETGCTIIQESVAPPQPPAQDEKPGSLTGTVFSDSISVAPYYEASLPTYSGLIRPEDLQDYWQNLKTVKELEVETTTLDTYFVEADSNVAQLEAANWLFVDSLPSGRILGGAKHFLSSLDGVVLRAIKQKDPVKALKDSRLDFTTKALADAGFSLAHVEISRHPDFCHGIFVRDWKSSCTNQIDAISQAAKTNRDNYESELVQRQQDIKTLDLARNTLSEKLAGTISEVEFKNDQISELNTQLSNAETKTGMFEQNVAALTAQVKMASAKLDDTSVKLNDADAALKYKDKKISALQADIDTLKTVSTELKDNKAKLRDAETTIGGQEKQLSTLAAEIKTLSAVNNELENAKRKLQAELEAALARAETAHKRQLIAENNLNELQLRYSELAKTRDEQAKRFGAIQSELKAALEIAKPARATKTAAKRKSSPS